MRRRICRAAGRRSGCALPPHRPRRASDPPPRRGSFRTPLRRGPSRTPHRLDTFCISLGAPCSCRARDVYSCSPDRTARGPILPGSSFSASSLREGLFVSLRTGSAQTRICGASVLLHRTGALVSFSLRSTRGCLYAMKPPTPVDTRNRRAKPPTTRGCASLSQRADRADPKAKRHD